MRYIEHLNRVEGITIFLTTQYLEEADRLCKRLAIIDHGKLVAMGSPTELKASIGADSINISLQDGQQEDGVRDRAKKVIAGIGGIADVQESDGGLTAHAKNASHIIADVIRALDEENITLASVSVSTPTLDDVFMHYTGRRIRAEELGKMPDRRIGFRGARR